jgi:Sulfotransferase family
VAQPLDIEIDDLAAPRLPDFVRVMNALAPDEARRRVPLDEAGLFEEARRQTGLSDFGDDDFREGLRVLLDALEGEADLTLLGRTSARGQIVRLLANRLLVEDAIARHPQALDRPMDRPLVIVGLPRTGTSHLHNLLSVHPQLRFLPYWESCEPMPAPEDEHRSGLPDPRIARTQAGLDQGTALIPHQQAMHELAAETPHEEIGFLQMAFACPLFSTMYHVPAYHEWYRRSDLTASYAYARRVLQLVSHLRDSGKRWVLKSPMHLEQMGPLMKTWPDARVVMTFRDPARVTLSMATMTAYNRRLSARAVDPVAIGRVVADTTRYRFDCAVRDVKLIPTEQLCYVHFDEYMADPIAAVRRVLEFAGLDSSNAALVRVRSYQDEHPRGKLGRVIYRYDDVGLDPRSIRADALRYMEFFAVKREENA